MYRDEMNDERAAAELARDRALVCVMGEMLELGDEADREHVELGRALAAARALLRHGEMSPADMVREAMAIAADICVFTNGNLTLEVLDAE